jgi:hypothetical protein
VTNGLFIEVASISFLGPLYGGAFFFLYQGLHIKNLQVYICSLILLKYTSNECCIGWFSGLKHILKSHAGLWSRLENFYLMFLEVSCVMCTLESLEFGVLMSVVPAKIKIFIQFYVVQ